MHLCFKIILLNFTGALDKWLEDETQFGDWEVGSERCGVVEECRIYTPHNKTIQFCECGSFKYDLLAVDFLILGENLDCAKKSKDDCASKTIDGDDNDSEDAKLFKKLINEKEKEKKGKEEPGTDYGMGECLVQKGSLGKSSKMLVHYSYFFVQPLNLNCYSPDQHFNGVKA